jgi:hypothetical protein
MKIIGYIGLGFIFLILIGQWLGSNERDRVKFLIKENNWQSPDSRDYSLARTLSKSRARSCGSFQQIRVGSSEYIVRCGFEDEGYLYYIVYTASEKAIGPYSSLEKTIEVGY